MSQTFSRVKESLVALLEDKDRKVIALTGKWGTGKTFLWESVKTEQFGKSKASEQPIYVSLFGVRTITRPEYQTMEERILDSPLRKYHPEVIAKMNAMRDAQHPPLTVIETAERIISNSGWGEREKISLRNSSVQIYKDALQQLTGKQLHLFLSLHLEWARRNTPYDENFKVGTDNFLAACLNINSENPNSRLSKIIYRAFESNGLVERLHSNQSDIEV